MAAAKTPKDFGDYLAKVPEPARSSLEKLRRIIQDAVPQATETIGYRMPVFRYGGKPLLGLQASKDHCSLHTMGYIPAELEPDLRGYDTGRGTVRFPKDKPLPAALVRKIARVRVAQIEGKA